MEENTKTANTTFYERCSDDTYAKYVGNLIDIFYVASKGTNIQAVVTDQANMDMVEILTRNAVLDTDRYQAAIIMFMLGVYLASKNEAILPSNLQ